MLFAARVATASEGPAAHGGGIPVGTLVFSTINLALFAWILARFVLPPVRDWVRDRRGRVINALEEAAAAKAAAAQLLAEWNGRLAQLDETIAERRAQAQQDAQRERDRVLAAAHKRAEAIRKDAERAAAYEVRRTQQQLRAELVRQAVARAQEQARVQWSDAHQRRLVADFLEEVMR
ncbi:MAG: hypothetical protein ACE5I7_10135 [Candidatus Binatia bacterium]